MAKWDFKDGFWHLDCQVGEEYNFAYVLLQPAGSPPALVIPMLIQMGWIESMCISAWHKRLVKMLQNNIASHRLGH